MKVLERGGVIAGSSAGASILGDFMVRGAPSNDNNIMDYPGYERAFRVSQATLASISTSSRGRGYRIWPIRSFRDFPTCSPSQRTKERHG